MWKTHNVLLFQFPNSACSSSTAGRNGTCYTSSECTTYGYSLVFIFFVNNPSFFFRGTASGTCASSFGVCCIFEKTCDGGSVSQNLTYFTSSGRSLGSACQLTICKVIFYFPYNITNNFLKVITILNLKFYSVLLMCVN